MVMASVTMSDLKTEIISGVVGAVAGGLAGAVAAWLFAPTQAEREERGRQRVNGRQQIAGAISALNYQLAEARGRLFRLEDVDDAINVGQFIKFAGDIRVGASFLPRFERWRIVHRIKNLTGKLTWRLAEIVPPGHYSCVDEATLLKATADTRTSNDVVMLSVNLSRTRPTDPRWDALLKTVEKLGKSYPG